MRYVRAVVSAVFGVAFAALGIVLVSWVGLTVYRVELGVDWMMWVLGHSPIPLSDPPLELANAAVQDKKLIPWGILGAFLCLIGYRSLRSARDAIRPEGESSGGEAKLELKTPEPRVGRPLEGSLRLLQDPQPGEVFRLELSCSRSYRTGDSDSSKYKEETAFFAQQDIAAAQSADGWRLPFRFDVPLTAPPSGATGHPPGDPYSWQLAFYRADAVIAVGSTVLLRLGAAPPEELRAAEGRETAEQKAAIEDVQRKLGPMLPHQREQLRALSPADLAMAQKVAAMPHKIAMTVIKWFAILFFGLPLVSFLIFVLVMLVK